MKEPSLLGTAIEEAIDRDGRFRRLREPVQYLCFYQTSSGHAFAVERVTLNQIRLWLSHKEHVRSAAEKEGLVVTKSVPYPDPSDPLKYGRLSSLKSAATLCDVTLYVTAVVSVHQALAVLSALHE